MKKTTTGFTIVELLIVIVVIAILAAISMVAYTNIQGRARDSRRASDIAQIKKALLAYDVLHGGIVIPGVAGYQKPVGEPSYGGFDVSTGVNWLIFLRGSGGMMPVDPVNANFDVVQLNNVNNKLYAYYCYSAGVGNAFPDSATGYLRYYNESGTLMVERFRVTSCLAAIPS